MAIITYSSHMQSFLAHLFEPRSIPVRKKRKGTKKQRAKKIYRFRTIGRAFQNRQGPGRRHKRR